VGHVKAVCPNLKGTAAPEPELQNDDDCQVTGQAVALSERELQMLDFGPQEDDIDVVPQSPQESEATEQQNQS